MSRKTLSVLCDKLVAFIDVTMNGRMFTMPHGHGHNWVYYVVYFVIAVLIAWGALFVMLRTEMIQRGTWLYDHTTWIPGLGHKS